MTQKRKAEIQRKLSLARLPEPPAGLEERIKADIPRYLLEPQRERARLERWMSISLRAAAAVLLLVTSTVALVQLFSETDPATLATAAPPPMIERAGQSSNSVSSFEIPSAPAVQTTAKPLDARAAGASGIEAEMTRPVMTVARRIPAREERRDLAAPTPVAPPPPPASAVPQQAGVSGNAVAAETSRFAEEPAAARPEPPPAAPATAPFATTLPLPLPERDQHSNAAPGRLFGISADPDAFGRIKRAIEAGERPSSADVDVEALINYFAGAAKRSRRDVSLDVEGSPAPVTRGANTVILRFTVDTAASAPRASQQSAATDARIEIELDRNAIASYRRVGGSESTSAAEANLNRNVSITGLYEVELKPRLRSYQRIATIRLRYRLTPGGREQTLERTIRAGNVSPSWMAATPRHRLASLGAFWGESLMSAAKATEVARKAEELAVREPKDERAKELAEAATASSRL